MNLDKSPKKVWVRITGKGGQYQFGKVVKLWEHQLDRYRDWGYQVEILHEVVSKKNTVSHARQFSHENSCERDEISKYTKDSSRSKIDADDIIDVMLALEKGV